jgi:hypothetical protein
MLWALVKMDMSITKKWLVSQFELFEESKIVIMVKAFDIHFMHNFDFFLKN